MAVLSGSQAEADRETLRDDEARTIRVPGPWQAQFDDLRDYSGVAWYRRRFAADGRTDGLAVGTRGLGESGHQEASVRPPDRPSAYLLHFGAVDYFATVWLNGQQVGEHEGGYLPFELDVSAALRPGRPNELVVRVVDPGNDADFLPEFTFAEIPHGSRAGTDRSAGSGRASTSSAAPDPLTRSGSPRMSRGAGPGRHRPQPPVRPAPRSLAQRHRSPGTGAAASLRGPGREGAGELTIPVPEPMLWDTTDPNLYELQAVAARQQRDRAEPVDLLAPASACAPSRPPPPGICCSTAGCSISGAHWTRITTPS